MGWIQDRWHQVTGATSGTWLAWAAWAVLALGVVALVFTNAQIKRNRRLAAGGVQAACRDADGAARRGLACDRTGGPEFRPNRGPRYSVCVS